MIQAIVSDEKLARYARGRHQAEVFGVFRSAVYLQAEEEVLMIHDACWGCVPFGLAVEHFTGQGRELGLESGTELILEKGLLSRPGEAPLLRISARKPSAAQPGRAEDLPALTALWQELLTESGASALAVYCRPAPFGGTDDPFAAAGRKGMLLLTEGLEKADGGLLETALGRLLGLGRGLTPSFDDFLCALLFLLGYAEKHWGARLPELALLRGAAARLAPDRTNRFSLPYLLSAAAGGDFSLMRRCLEGGGRPAAERLCALGGSSGADMLSGLCFGAACFLRRSS